MISALYLLYFFSRDFLKKAHARSFYINGCQNYRRMPSFSRLRSTTIYMKIKHLHLMVRIPLFGT
jgi:hypothetical protein